MKNCGLSGPNCGGMLRELEWGAVDDWGAYCPSCSGYKDGGKHEPDCRLAALLEETNK